MRTDSHVAVGAGADRGPQPGAGAVRRRVRAATRRGTTRSKVKNAQEAHEAIRPAGDRFRTPAQVAGELRGEEFALYDLIWKRTIASQMADARGSTASVRLGATLDDGAPATTVELSATGTVITFRGFLAAYEEGRDERQARAPRTRPRRSAACRGSAVGDRRCAPCAPRPTATRPPRRRATPRRPWSRRWRSAASAGPRPTPRRSAPSRTAATSSKRGSALVPSWLAFAVTRLLEEHFSRLVDYDFTASMEEDLDAHRRAASRGGSSLAAPLLLRRRGEVARGAARPRRGPRRHRRPGDLDRSTSARASSCASAATAPTSRRPCRRASTRPPAR